ncbi:hypothetical protein [Halobacteriovorax sp. YZS-1-1]|uniref:hypothetical protein n=1 Tax=unclassified Halobacteriovorax TaxID=2639665 RepID=UPI00399B7234
MLRSKFNNIFTILLSLILVSQVSVYGNNFKSIQKSEIPKIKQLLGSSKKLDKKAVIEYIKQGLPESSTEFQNLIYSKLEKEPENKRAHKLSEYMYSEKKYLNAGDACYSATNQCSGKLVCDFPIKLDVKDQSQRPYEKCLVPKNKNQHCSIFSDYCLEGSCKRMIRVTDINTCQTYKESCRRDSECCSNSCDKETKTCKANYKCSSCIGIGSRPGKNQECCESLFKNSNGVCAPIIPSFSAIPAFLMELLIPSVQAAEVERSEQLKTSVVSAKANMKKLLTDNGVNNSKINTYMNQLESQISNCDSKPVKIRDRDSGFSYEYPRQECFKELSDKITIEANHQSAVARKKAEATKILDDFRNQTKTNPKHPQHSESAFESFQAPYISALNSCIDKNTQLGDPNTSRRKSRIDNCVNNIKVNINDGVIEADYISMLRGGDSTDPDYKLYSGMDDSSPLFKDISISDMKSCRVNLFGDFLSKQSDSYFEMMMMMFAMDYTTGGKDEGDFFHIKSQYNTAEAARGNLTGTSNIEYNWNVQVNSMRGYNLDLFDPSMVGKGKPLWDEFDQSVGEAALKEIQNYLNNLPDKEEKIFLHLFYNGKITADAQNNIINYYMRKDPKYLAGFDGNNPKDRNGRYNIRDVVRFEAVKYKHSLYKLYSTLKKRSLEMMCRCVDTVGPMSPTDWLQPDVEANYIANCNGLGMYDSYVINSEKTVCDENEENCNQVGSKDYLDTVHKKEVESVEEAGGSESIVENSVGTKIVKNEGYNVAKRENDYFVQTLDKVTACIGSGECDKTSRYDEFVSQGKVSFEAVRKETAKGHGEDFTLFLRDMALMKIKAIEDASLQNLSHGTALFEYTVQWLKEYNWNYIKYNGQKYTLSRKCLYPVCWIMQLMKFLGLHKNSLFNRIVNVSMTGVMGILSDADMDLDPERGPENICGPRTKSSWKIARVTVGKKYKIKCMKFLSRKNDVCNQEMAVGVCSRNTYVKREGGVALRIIDPFLPDMSSNYNTSYRSSSPIRFNAQKEKTLNYFPLDDKVTNYYRDHAKGYFLSTLISEDNGFESENTDRKRMAQEFAQYAYRYHFYAPKVTKLDYYITPGLIPYFELLIAKMNNYMGQTLANLSSTAAYALKMHNYWYTVKEGLTDNTKLDRKQTQQPWDQIQLNNGFGEFTNWLSGFSTATNNFKDAMTNKKGANSSIRGRLEAGKGSSNKAISDLSRGVSRQISNNDRRRKDLGLMRDALKKRGKSSEFDNLQKLADERRSEHDSVLSSLSDSFRDGTFGSGSSQRSRGSRLGMQGEDTSSNGEQEGYSQEAINPDALKNGKSRKGGVGTSSNTKVGSNALNEDSLIDFSNLEDTEGLFEMDDDAVVTIGNSKMTAGQLKDHLRNLKEKDSRRAQLSKQDKEWERDGVSLFQIISQRYQLYVFPKVLE